MFLFDPSKTDPRAASYSHVNMLTFSGVYAVVPTPFLPTGAVDLASLRRVVRLYAGAGIDGLTALGVTSETVRLSDAEREQVVETIMEEAPSGLPVVVGATAQGIEPCIEYASRAKRAGGAAAMISPPRMASFNERTVLHHFESVSNAVDLPIIAQDYPESTGFAMSATFLASLPRRVERVRAIKLEDAPSPPKIARVLAELGDRPVSIFGGLGGVFLLEELLAGATGAMTGFSFPEALVEIVRLFRAGNLRAATERFYHYVPLLRFEFQAGIGMALRKEILRRRGVLASATVRSPAAALDPATIAALDHLLEWYRARDDATWIRFGGAD